MHADLKPHTRLNIKNAKIGGLDSNDSKTNKSINNKNSWKEVQKGTNVNVGESTCCQWLLLACLK